MRETVKRYCLQNDRDLELFGKDVYVVLFINEQLHIHLKHQKKIISEKKYGVDQEIEDMKRKTNRNLRTEKCNKILNG